MAAKAKVREVCAAVAEMAPEALAEAWDNCGLLLGDPGGEVTRVVTCLDVTAEVAEAAEREGAQLVVSHHPLIFTPLRGMTEDAPGGALLARLVRRGVSVYSAHTNADKTYGGLNDLLAGIVGLEGIQPQGGPQDPPPHRFGTLPEAMAPGAFLEYLCARLKQDGLGVAPGDGRAVRKVAVMCGSFGMAPELLAAEGVDAVVTGEMKHHDALWVSASGVLAACAGHHGTERFFTRLAKKWIEERFPDLPVLCAGFDSFPLRRYNVGQGE
jgi:dinuclear metal center YbgI/SA1388 family protein